MAKKEDKVDPVAEVPTPTETPVENTVKPQEVEQVKIPASTLQRILEQLDKQDTTLKQNAEQIADLRTAASQGKLLEAENARKPADLPKAFLKVFMGKIVVGWRNVKTEMIYNPANPDAPIGEILKSVYTFLDGSESAPTDQVLFTRCEDRVIVSLLISKDEFKNPSLREVKVRFEYLISSDEQLKATFVVPTEEATVNINFINP